VVSQTKKCYSPNIKCLDPQSFWPSYATVWAPFINPNQGNQKSIKSIFVCRFKGYGTSRNQTSHSYHERLKNYHVKKNQNLSVKLKLPCSIVFSLYRYFIKATTTDIDMLLQVWLQFCHTNEFIATSDVIL